MIEDADNLRAVKLGAKAPANDSANSNASAKPAGAPTAPREAAPAWREQPTGLTLPMDAAAALRLEGFFRAFPDASLQALTAHVDAYFDWANEVPELQLKMAALVAEGSGQRPA